jgi:hypothetical protein
MPERALRRLVADLARAGDGEVEKVLGELPPPQRRRVSVLLLELNGESRAPAPAPDEVPPTSGLSPWLAARVEDGGRFGLTGATRDALLAAAIELCPRAEVSAPKQGRSLLSAIVRGKRRA